MLASKWCLVFSPWFTELSIEHFRDFFAREAGRNTVEFFKDDGKDQLYIALRFESKDIAKEVLNR